MAVLSVTFAQNQPDITPGWPVPRLDFSTAENLTIGASSVQSTAAPAGRRMVMLHAEAACRVRIGSNPTALSTDTAIGAGQTVFLACEDSDIVAMIQF
jgi:hypothetical protein